MTNAGTISSRLLSSCLKLSQRIPHRHLRRQRRLRSDDHHSTYNYPRLSKHQVSTILQAEEKSIDINHEAVLRYVQYLLCLFWLIVHSWLTIYNSGNLGMISRNIK